MDRHFDSVHSHLSAKHQLIAVSRINRQNHGQNLTNIIILFRLKQIKRFVCQRTVTYFQIFSHKYFAEIVSQKTPSARVDVGLAVADDGSGSCKNYQPFFIEQCFLLYFLA